LIKDDNKKKGNKSELDMILIKNINKMDILLFFWILLFYNNIKLLIIKEYLLL
jgi:hypothetical protein